MTLPDLALQIVYARLGWAVVAACFLAALLASMLRLAPLPRKLLGAILAGALVAMALPGELSPAYWLGLAFQYPSGLLVGCCAVRLVERWQGIRRSRAMPHALAGVLVVCGTLLYLDTFGLLARGLYDAGFGPTLVPLLAVLGAAACAWAVTRGHARGAAAPLLAAIALFSLLRLPSGNLWDALLDPLLCLWAIGALLAAAFGRSGRRATDRVQPPAQSPMAPRLEPASLQPISSLKE